MGTFEQLVADEREISQTVIQYATGVDMRDWELYRNCFTDPVEIDFSCSGSLHRVMPVDEWVEHGAQSRERLCLDVAHQHQPRHPGQR